MIPDLFCPDKAFRIQLPFRLKVSFVKGSGTNGNQLKKGMFVMLYLTLWALLTQVAKLVEMGIPAEAAQAALEKAGGDENAALEVLFSS